MRVSFGLVEIISPEFSQIIALPDDGGLRSVKYEVYARKGFIGAKIAA